MTITGIRNIATGELQNIEADSLPGYDLTLWQVLGDLDEAADPMLTTWDSETESFILADAVADTLFAAAIDRDREALQMGALTAGVAKSWVYGQKAAEIRDFNNLTSDQVAALSPEQIAARFPFAAAEADLTGDTLTTVIARFADGLVTATAEVARIEALAMVAKRDVSDTIYKQLKSNGALAGRRIRTWFVGDFEVDADLDAALQALNEARDQADV